jgi:hypothetical protein
MGVMRKYIERKRESFLIKDLDIQILQIYRLSISKNVLFLMVGMMFVGISKRRARRARLVL